MGDRDPRPSSDAEGAAVDPASQQRKKSRTKIISRVDNGYIVSARDPRPSSDDEQIKVFSSIEKALEHVKKYFKGLEEDIKIDKLQE